jgi:endonuclease/exonuclease/phosphatase family metal-dependent hydrolase
MSLQPWSILCAHMKRMPPGSELALEEIVEIVNRQRPNTSSETVVRSLAQKKVLFVRRPNGAYALQSPPSWTTEAPTFSTLFLLPPQPTTAAAAEEEEEEKSLPSSAPPPPPSSAPPPPPPSVVSTGGEERRALPTLVSTRTIRIASWNLGGAAGAGMRVMPRVVAEIVEEMSVCDVLVFQEALRTFSAEFQRLLPNHSLMRANPIDNAGFDHAFFVRKSLSSEAEVGWLYSPTIEPVRGAKTSTCVTGCYPMWLRVVGLTIVSIHAPVRGRERDVFLGNVFGERLFALLPPTKRDAVVLAGDFNVDSRMIRADRRRWCVTADEFTWTSNTMGCDYFALTTGVRRTYTHTQHELTQTRRKNTSTGSAGASNHDAVVLTLRARGYDPIKRVVSSDHENSRRRREPRRDESKPASSPSTPSTSRS